MNLRLLRRLVTRLAMSLIFITHDLSLIGQMCDDLAIMCQGRFVEVGPALEVLAHSLRPYTRELIAAVPVADPSRRPSAGSATLLETAPPSGAGLGCRFAPRCAYVADRCRVEDPSLRVIDAAHQAACHRTEELPAMDGVAGR